MPRYQPGALMTPGGMMPLATVSQPMMLAARPMVSVSGHTVSNAAGMIQIIIFVLYLKI